MFYLTLYSLLVSGKDFSTHDGIEEDYGMSVQSIVPIQGRTALAVLEEQMSSVAESGQRYELLEEHKAIAKFLRGEMRQRGMEECPGGLGWRELVRLQCECVWLSCQSC